jgi:L1 cell adhesion molecule like protein
VEVEALHEGVDFRTTLTRARFEDLCSAWFRDTLEVVDKVLRDAKLSKSQIDDVVLVGGSTRIPRIQTLLSQHFQGKDLCRTINVDEAVAYGAAVQAALLGGMMDDTLEKMILMDVCPLSLGIETAGGVMTKIVERNTTIPCAKKQMFSTYAPNQTAVDIKVFEGERTMTAHNNLLGNFKLGNIPPMPRGVPKIEVSFDIDTNGILKVTALETSAGRKESLVITNDKGRLSKEQIEEMLKDAEKFAAEDEVLRTKLEAKQKLEGFLFSAKTSLEELKEKGGGGPLATPEIIGLALAEVGAALQWLDDVDMPKATVEMFEEKQKEMERAVHPIFANASPPEDDGSASQPSSQPSSENPHPEAQQRQFDAREDSTKGKPYGKPPGGGITIEELD